MPKCDSPTPAVDCSSRMMVESRPPAPPPRRKKCAIASKEVKLKPICNNKSNSVKPGPKKKLSWALTYNEENVMCDQVTVKVILSVRGHASDAS